MSHLHDPTNPRHARMFELLRQTQQASRVSQRIKVIGLKQVDDEVAEKIKESAVQSLRCARSATK